MSGLTLEDCLGRVAAGMAWMDQHAARDWRGRVNLWNFNMEEPCLCVVGQVFGDYWQAIFTLEGIVASGDYPDVVDWEVEHGFNLPEGQDDPEDWDTLERAWVLALAPSARWRRVGLRAG